SAVPSAALPTSPSVAGVQQVWHEEQLLASPGLLPANRAGKGHSRGFCVYEISGGLRSDTGGSGILWGLRNPWWELSPWFGAQNSATLEDHAGAGMDGTHSSEQSPDLVFPLSVVGQGSSLLCWTAGTWWPLGAGLQLSPVTRVTSCSLRQCRDLLGTAAVLLHPGTRGRGAPDPSAVPQVFKYSAPVLLSSSIVPFPASCPCHTLRVQGR
ncbi:hypothetical protein DV515_00014977, partial [Chloebia gouldiae]